MSYWYSIIIMAGRYHNRYHAIKCLATRYRNSFLISLVPRLYPFMVGSGHETNFLYNQSGITWWAVCL